MIVARRIGLIESNILRLTESTLLMAEEYQSPTPGSNKQRIELQIAEQFILLFNRRHSTNFRVKELRDTPDVLCVDPDTGEKLELEISIIEDLPGSIRHILRKGPKPKSPTTGTTVVSFNDDAVKQLRNSLSKKLLSVYGANTALVLYQSSILWDNWEWQTVAESFRSKVLKGKEANYGAGVWIICTDNSTFPAGNDLFCLSDPI
jgi:hypothetical protein